MRSSALSLTNRTGASTLLCRVVPLPKRTSSTRAGRLTDLCGEWSAIEADDDLRRSFPRPEIDDSKWETVTVPGHWRAEPRFAASDGPLLYRRHFEMGTLAKGERAWLVMDGIFYQSDVWLDGSYLGDTEGYFFPHAFEVTSALEERSEHLLGLEVVCERTTKRRDKRALTGVFGNWDCIDPAFNPGGIGRRPGSSSGARCTSRRCEPLAWRPEPAERSWTWSPS